MQLRALRRWLPWLGSPEDTVARVLSQHRQIMKRDVEHMRWTRDGGWVMPEDNPGLRVEPSFVSKTEAKDIALALREACAAFGYPYDGDERAHLLSPGGAVDATLDGVVNNIRVTGRLEKPEVQKLAPGGYGDGYSLRFSNARRSQSLVRTHYSHARAPLPVWPRFDLNSLPPALTMLTQRIASCGAFAVGAPRDCTVNARERSFFQLDPHVDPLSDGPDVFILGLESSVVLTFTPPDDELAAAGLERRGDPHDVGMRSWTDRDIDVLVQPGTLLHFSGAARDTWKHAIRAGVLADTGTGTGTGGGGGVVCDWWGQPDYLIQRAPTRLSVVLAFGARAEVDEGVHVAMAGAAAGGAREGKTSRVAPTVEEVQAAFRLRDHEPSAEPKCRNRNKTVNPGLGSKQERN
jgi:hypothetical protein